MDHPFDSAIDHLKHAFNDNDAATLATILVAHPSQLVQLRTHLQSYTFDTITAAVESQNLFSNDSRINELAANIARDYFRYIRDYDSPPDRVIDSPQARLKRDFKAFDSLTQRIADMYKLNSVDWLSDVVKSACAELLNQAAQVDWAYGPTDITTTSDAAARLLKVLLVTTQGMNIPRIGRPGPGTLARASTAFSIANALFRTYRKLDSMHLFTSVVQPMRQLPALLDHVPKADAVQYRYWLGRYKLSTGNVHHAREILSLAFDRCHNSSKNKRIILTYLVVAAMACGRFPSPDLLEAFDLRAQYQPIVDAIRHGDGAGLHRHLDSWMAWFARRDLLFLLREKMDVLIWRTLCRKAALVTDGYGLTSDKDVEVSLRIVTEGLRLSYQDASYDLDDAEMIVVCLIDQGYMRGGIVHSSNTIKKLHIPPVALASRSALTTVPDNLYSL